MQSVHAPSPHDLHAQCTKQRDISQKQHNVLLKVERDNNDGDDDNDEECANDC